MTNRGITLLSLLNKPRTYLLKLTFAVSLIALTGCGGSSNDDTTKNLNSGGDVQRDQVNTSNIRQAKIRTDVNSGITQGIKSSVNNFTTIITSSGLFPQVSAGSSSDIEPQSPQLDVNITEDLVSSSLDSFSELIDRSDIAQNGNVYSFNPRESEICLDDESTPTEIADCKALLADIGFVVTVDKVENNEVVAATTIFKYENNIFATISFDNQSAYYQIDLAGTQLLLVGINRLASEEEKSSIASTMEGSIRLSLKTDSENNGSLTLSIPSALHVVDTTPGEEIDISIPVTSQLLSMTADGDAKTMDIELNLEAFNLKSTDEDDSGNSYPTQLIIGALTGKLALTEDGDKLTLIGVTANSVLFKVDNSEALKLNLDSLNALINSSGTHNVYTLNDVLNLDLSIRNIKNYFDDIGAPTDQLTINAKAPSGTVITELEDQGLIKVTSGTVELKVGNFDGTVIDATISSEECLSTADDLSIQLVNCPASL